jgi:hypothetical protein
LIIIFIVIIVIVIAVVITIIIIIVTVFALIIGTTQPSSQALNSRDNTNRQSLPNNSLSLLLLSLLSVPEDDVCVVPKIGNLWTFFFLVVAN